MSRLFGKNTIMLEEFVNILNHGKRGLWIGADVVAMPAKHYWALVQALHRSKKPTMVWYDEAEELDPTLFDKLAHLTSPTARRR